MRSFPLSQGTAMKILLVGASGTLGQAVAHQLGQLHQILAAGRNSGELRVDLTDDASVAELFSRTGPVDAVISTAGKLHFGPLKDMTPEQFNLGLQDKLLGQVRLALVAQHHLNAGGSITLTSGIVSAQPIRDGVNATSVNAALEGFVRAAALELLPRGLRINVVSPNVLIESMAAYGPYFPGFEAVSAQRAALAFQRAVEGIQSGETITVW
ncbi:short chain dehydrogenase [Stenotrophomonas sp. C4297]|uniref:short chain dehydrogenase n=1 Tax=Stenotrophomonas sp. C4297 TaxID=3077847 RepID=UPI00293C4A3D|nr:short chain dehydrogenase [Stenotrophomonas sp. C4297]MDV3510585.1 short chain dehydrogenase [Stenotrophomonas sp. C4297]